MIISPSMLSADFANLQRDTEMLNRSECEWIHLDVMDGVFVPNISFGFPVIEAIARHAKKTLDVHLMIVHPENYIDELARIGADIVTVHQEACPHLHRVIQAIHSKGMKAGVALNPATPVSLIEDIIGDVDLVLLMSVNPGFGGQKFIPQCLQKVRRLRQMITESGSTALIEIDGGVNRETAPLLRDAGADAVVAGSAVFKAADPEEEIRVIKQ